MMLTKERIIHAFRDYGYAVESRVFKSNDESLNREQETLDKHVSYVMKEIKNTINVLAIFGIVGFAIGLILGMLIP